LTTPPPRILNLGCGNQTYGTHRADITPTKTTTHVFDVEKGIPFPDCYFDEVYEQNLFEHLKNPNFHLKEIHRILKPNGHLTLITDNAACIRYYLLRTHTGGYMGHRHLLTRNTDKHYAIYTKEHLKNHLQTAGFQIISLTYTETDYPTRFIDKTTRKLLTPLKSLTYPRIHATCKKPNNPQKPQ
jgi:predicted SAM-dependent methyltransferase